MVLAYSASKYLDSGISDKPPFANALTNTWSSRKSVVFNATVIPLESVYVLKPMVLNVFVAVTVPGGGNGFAFGSIKCSGTSNIAFGEISPRFSSSWMREHAWAMSVSVTVGRPSIARITQLLSRRSLSANCFKSCVVIFSTHATVKRASSSAPTTSSPLKKCPTSSSRSDVQYVWSRSTKNCCASAVCFSFAIFSSCSENP
mmetsp:Transcript_5246/g.19643  ORF Transcript_5246/g.19643 Transcript_5246/m.19643 type:complete len:202 (+) Transcript_5246:1736-2341(+)